MTARSRSARRPPRRRGGTVRRGGRGRARAAAQPARPPSPLEPLGTTARRSIRPSKAGDRSRTARRSLLLGYYNRNKTQALDIPIGPDNRIEPGGPDYGQPTHFDPAGRRHVRDPRAEGLREQEADVDADGERPDRTV